MRYYGYAGILMIAAAFILPSFLAYGPYLVASANLMLMIGLWLTFDAIDFMMNKSSFLNSWNSKTFANILFIALFIGLFIEMFGAFVSNLWWEPFYVYLSARPLWQSIIIFLFTAIVITYGFILPAAYSIFKVARKILIKKKHITIRDSAPSINLFMPVIGLSLIILPIILVLTINLSDLIRGLIFILPLAGLWLIIEHSLMKNSKHGMLHDLKTNDFTNSASVTITAIIIGLLVEIINLLAPAWNYKNFPLSNIYIWKLPLIPIIAWVPLVALILLSYNLLSNEEIF